MTHTLECICTVALLVLLGLTANAQEQVDPYLWLESTDGQKSLEWVRAHDATTLATLKRYPEFERLYNKNVEVYTSDVRIAYPEIRGKYIYNLWQDAHYERGLWRRTTLPEYLSAKPTWETVLDIDSLSKAEGEGWIFQWAEFLQPECNLCAIGLSRGGGDAVVVREFDLRMKRFVTNGFNMPEAKPYLSWMDENTLLVGTDFGKGSLTTAGYPRTARLWKRGTPLSESRMIFEGDSTDVSVGGGALKTPERQYVFIWRNVGYFSSQLYALDQDTLVRLAVPLDAILESIMNGQLVLLLKSDWTVNGALFSRGMLVSIDYEELLRGVRNIRTVFVPSDSSSVMSVDRTDHCVLVNLTNNIRGELCEYSFHQGVWSARKVPAPEYGTIRIATANAFSGQYFFSFTSFLTPWSLYLVNAGESSPRIVKREPEYFDAQGFEVSQRKVKSTDGTSIPYFLVAKKNAVLNGQTPVILEGYGGFDYAMLPYYKRALGYSWLERGGAYVLANIRGGGEFGPQWHLSAIKEHRQRAYDDFIAVAEDLIRSGITSPNHLGILGASNGGLLVGVAVTQRPDLFGGVVCEAPLLDMKRYSKIPPGASWIAEYGDPDIPEEWAYIRKYSPYHHVSPQNTYPEILFLTSSADDRVHPSHARKMVAKMEAMGHKVLFYEETEGGHASETKKQMAFTQTLIQTYFLHHLR
jgi:prolyl oligopeptidase